MGFKLGIGGMITIRTDQADVVREMICHIGAGNHSPYLTRHPSGGAMKAASLILPKW
jgi:hypothetical protein